METQRNLCGYKRLNLFKSYYVVWKQSDIKIIKIVCKRLNRTMQYGNRKRMRMTVSSR